LRFNRDPADNGKRRVAAALTTATPGSAAPWSILRLRLRLIYNNGKPLHEQRWYSTMITLQDGRTLIGGGGVPYAIFDAYQNPWWWLPDISVTPEVFTPGIGWTPMWHLWSLDAFGPTNNRGYYPRMWVAPDGTVFGISTEKVWSINLTSGTITTLRDFKTAPNSATLPNVGPTSTAVMYDVGKIIQMGGNGYTNAYPSPSSPYATIDLLHNLMAVGVLCYRWRR
jgi:galactose oxidase